MQNLFFIAYLAVIAVSLILIYLFVTRNPYGGPHREMDGWLKEAIIDSGSGLRADEFQRFMNKP
jgi:hypothetical protein